MGLSGRRNARHACPAWRRNGMKMLECVRNALVIAPHPDDEVLGCGGTIARLTSGGAQVHVAIVTRRSEEHTSELQSLMRISYAVFCLKKKKHKTQMTRIHTSDRTQQ